MNKFRKGLLAMSIAALTLGGLTACNQTSAELQQAQTFLYQAYKDEIVNTDDYKMPSKIIMNGVSYPITWAVNVTEGDASNVKVGTEVDDKGYITIDVAYAPYATNETKTVYTLTATIADENGKTITQEFNKEIPVFKFTSHSDYLKAKAGEMINVEGYVVGAYPLYNGTTQVFVQTANGEGYYVYKLPVEETAFATDMALGNYIVVSGLKDVYNGTAEIVSATYKASSLQDVTVEPYDVTAIFDSAAKISDKSLVNLQGSLVTVKGVTITTVGSNGYLNWTKGGKDSYVRISSSGNVSDHDENAKKTLEDTVKNHFGYTADVTGIVSQYNGNFYLMPTSADSIKVTSTAADADFVFDYACDTLSVGEKIFSDLPSEIAGVQISWESTVDGLVSAEGKVTPEKDPKTTTLTATITLGTKSETKVFENVVVELPEPSPVTAINAAIAALPKDGVTGVFVLEGTIVAKDGSGRPYVMDSKGNVMFVRNNPTEIKNAALGTKVKLAGTGSNYNGLYQFGNDSSTFKVLELGSDVAEIDYGTPKAMTAEEFVKAVFTDKDQAMNGQYVKLTGVKLVKDGNFFGLSYGDGKSIQLQSKNIEGCKDANLDKEVVVYGYTYGANSSVARITAVAVELASEDDDTPIVEETKVSLTTTNLFPGISGTSYADYAGEHTVGGLTVTTTDMLTNTDKYSGGNTLQFKAETGSFVTSSTKVSKITIVVVDTFDVYKDAFKVKVGDTELKGTIVDVENTGIKNNGGYEFKLTTIEFVASETLEGAVSVSNNTGYAKYVTTLTIE